MGCMGHVWDADITPVYLRWKEGTVSESSVQHNDLSLQYKALTM